MNKFKALVITLACAAALSLSAAALTFGSSQQNNQNADACCDMAGCCKDGAMSCCKAKTKKGKNAHACCKGTANNSSCCCKGDSCPMPEKKQGNTNN
jgi:hypothetical protein